MKNILNKANKLKRDINEWDGSLFDIEGGIELGKLNNYPVIYWPTLMKENNEILGMATFSKKILVDDEFLNLSEYGKMNILYHELAHLEKKHLNLYSLDEYLKLRKKYTNEDSVLPIEIEADECSYEQLKKYGDNVFIEAMNKLNGFNACK